jgi:hypothetical protein
VPLGEGWRGSGLRVGSGEQLRGARPIGTTRRLASRDTETQLGRPPREDRGSEEVAQRAVRWVDARAALGGMRFDVRDGVRFDGIEAGVCPRRGAWQGELQRGGDEPRRSNEW